MADRSVSISLQARVTNYVAGMGQARQSTQNLSRQMQETGAYADNFRRRLEAATKALPKIEIDADSSPAELKFAQLRSEMDRLADKKIGIDIDAGAAQAQLQNIQRELEQLGRSETSVDVKADIGTALAELRALDSEIDRVDGRTANINVNANVGSALSNIALVGAALASLPAAVTVGAGIAGLGASFAAAGAGAAAFSAVAVPGLGRVNEALKAQASAAASAGGATGSAGASSAQAAQQALQLEDAEKRLKAAQTDAKQAQEDLTRAREDGRRALEDMNFSLDRSILSEKDAALAVREAAARMAEVNADPGSSDLERERAALSYEQALQRVEEQTVKTARAQKDTAVANKAGVEGTKEYQRGLEDVSRAQEKVAQAESQLKQLHAQQAAAMSSGGSAAGGAADAFAKLSKEEKKLAKDMQQFNDDYLDWQRSLQPDVFPVISAGLGLLTVGMNKATPLVKASAGAFGELVAATKKGIEGEQWTSFFNDLTVAAPRAITGLGTATGNIAGGLAGIIQAFLPYTGPLMDFLEKATQGFEDWGQSLKGSPEFLAFMNYVQTNGPKVAEVLSNLATFVGKILQVGAGAAPGVLDFLVTLSGELAKMDSAQIEAIAKGVGLVFAAVKIGATLQIGAIVALANLLAKMSPGQIQAVAIAISAVVVAVKGFQAVSAISGMMSNFGASIDRAGASAERNRGRFTGLGQAIGGIGGIAAVTAGLGMLDNQLNGLDTKVGTMSKEMVEFAKTGQLSGKMSEQWGDSLSNVVEDVGSLDEAVGRAGDSSESFREAISRLANPGPLESFKTSMYGVLNVASIGTVEFDKSAEKIAFFDQELSNLVSNGKTGEAAQAFGRLTKEAEAMGIPVDKVKDLFPLYSQAVETAGEASATAAKGIEQAKKQVDDFTVSLGEFSAQTSAAKAVQDLEKSYKDATVALKASNGELDINKRMTSEQRDAVIVARDTYEGYITKIDGIANSQREAGKNTADATISVAEQLPKLFELTSKSKDATEQVYDLAKKYGISREEADKARTGTGDFAKELEKIKSKAIKIDVDTKTAQAQLDNMQRTLIDIVRRASLATVGGLNTASARGNAWGGIQYADGRPDYMASGGIRSLGSNPKAMIAKSPYSISGRSGPDVVFGEAGMEAYIPLSNNKRGRGLRVMQEAAGIMGMAVVPEKMAMQSMSATSGSSSFSNGGSPATVTVTGVDALRSSLDTTATNLTGSLGGATSTLDATLGDTGTLTTSLDGVGEIAGTLAGEVTGWGEVISVQFPPLITAVADLKAAVSSAAATAKANAGSKADEGNPRDSEPGYVAGSAPKSKTSPGYVAGSAPKAKTTSTNNASAVKTMKDLGPQPGYIEGYANGGITNRPSIFGEAGWEAAIPLGRGKRPQGLRVLGQAAHRLGVSVNHSRRSRSMQSHHFGGHGSASNGSSSNGTWAAGGVAGGVNIYGMTVRSEADIPKVAAQIHMRRRGRG